jgi:hypothetical protein
MAVLAPAKVARTVINPLTTAAFGRLVDPAAFGPLKGQLAVLLINVALISWMHAAWPAAAVPAGIDRARAARRMHQWRSADNRTKWRP